MLRCFSQARSRLSTNCLLNTRILDWGTLFLIPQSSPASAVEFPNGQIAFDHPPSLIQTASSSTHHQNPAAAYHFTLEVPEDAGEPLKTVKIEQPARSLETLILQPEATRAFLGNSFSGGPAVSLATDEGITEPGNVTAVFDPPIPPGSTVTVVIKPQHNPFRGGVYLFQVTAFPAGDASLGQALGYGRLHIYD